MKIHFEVKDRWSCTTPCPYGFTNGFTGEPKKVGSIACYNCMHFAGIDSENNTIECDYNC